MADELDFSGALDRVLQQQATGAPTVSPATPATPLAPTTNLLTGAAPTPSPFAAALDQVLRGDTVPPPAATAPDMTEATPAPALPPSNDAQVVQEAASGVAAANGLLAEGVRPEVVAGIRRISRDQGIPLPLAAQTYIERAQAASSAHYRRLLQQNPGLRRIATQGAAYADFMTDADELATAEQAFTEAQKEWSVGTIGGSVEQLGNILADTLVGRAITRGTLQTIAALPTLGASLELGVALDIGATEEQILERMAAPYGGWAAMENYSAPLRMSVLAAARQQYNLVQGLTEDDRVAALQRAGEHFFSAGELVAQAEGLVRNPGSQSFITNTLSQAPNTVAGTLDAFASDPVNGGLFLAETILESAPNIAATVIVSRVTGSLSLGAAVGATTGGGREYVLSTTQFLAERGYTINSVEDAIAILQNAELMQEAADFGFARALPIAILDGLAGVASGVRLGSTVLGDVAAQTAVQMAAGGWGEALAQLASEGKITSPRDITIEALAELPTALIEVPLAAGRSFGSERLPPELNQLLAPGALQSAVDQAAAAQQALETARAAIEETATFARDPDAVRELLVAAGDQEVSIPVQEIERLYQEGALTDDDIAYLNVEDELTQQGELAGDVVTTASRVLTLQGGAFARLSEHVRTQAGAPTAAEAREALANREADITRLQATLEQAQNVAGEINTLADTITEQLRTTTNLSRGQARAAGRLLAERYAARAALFEPGTTAQSLYDRDRVTFEGERAASAPLLEQPAVEVVQPGIDGTYRVTEGQVRAELNVAPSEPYASSVQVPGGMQRQGIATALYDAAERDLGRRMFPSPLGLTSDAQQFWIDRLSRIPQAEALALLDEAQVSGDARNVGRSTAERLAPIRESVLSRDPVVGGGREGIGAGGATDTGTAVSFEQGPVTDNDTSVAGGLTEKSKILTRRLLGARITPMFADLTDAGSVFDALDGMPIAPTPFLGGPNFPWLRAYRDAGIVWAFNKPGVITGLRNRVRALRAQSLAEGGDGRVIITMLAMKDDAHTSNEMTINALLRTLDAVVEAGRFPPEQLTAAKDLITSKAGKADEGYAGLATFPGFGDAQALHDWIRGATFTTRKALATEMRSAAFQQLPGMFPVKRVVREAVDPDYRATQQGDALLAFEIDPAADDLLIDFDDPEQAGDIPRHPAYRYGMRGTLVGSFSTHIPMEVLYADLLAEITADAAPGSNPKFLMERLGSAMDYTVQGGRRTEDKVEFKLPTGAMTDARLTVTLQLAEDIEPTTLVSGQDYTFRQDTTGANKAAFVTLRSPLPEGATLRMTASPQSQLVTEDVVQQAETIEGLHDYRVAQAYTAGLAGQWRSSDDAANRGGINPVEFERALLESDAAATLTKYTRDDVKAGKKDGSLRVFQLGQERVQDGGLSVWMAVKAGLDYRQEYPGAVTDQLVERGVLTDNEVALVGVASNELGVSGMATFQVLKGIEEGVTVLDAFKVRSPSKPDGLLPTIYATLGFEEVGEIQFDPQYFDDQQLADLRAIWTRQGWNEADGFPAVAIMKWRGDDALRSDATRRFVLEGQAGLGIRGVPDAGQVDATPAGVLDVAEPSDQGDGVAGAGDGRADPRRYADRARDVSGRARDFVRNVLDADAKAIDALKLPRELILRIRETYGAGQTFEQPGQGPQTPQQGTVGAPRGSYTLPTTDDPRNLFRLTTTADASTVVHEVGHMFLFQMLRDLAGPRLTADPRLTAEGRAQLQGQIDATRAWFASNSEQAYTELQKLAKDASKRAARLADGPEKDAATLRATRLQGAVDRAKAGGGAAYMEQVAQSFMDPAAPGRDEAAELVYHELWARGFEKYLGTGSAPSAELRNVFAKFAQYISNVYKSLRRLNVTVSPEIADVFDRLLATEEAIIEERRGAMYQLSPGVLEGATPAEANELRRLASEAETQARTEMASRVGNSLKAEERAKRRARREALANEISEQVAAEPIYAATNIAKRGTLPDGTKTGTGKIDRAELIAVAGEEAVGRMPSGMVSGRVRPDNAIPLGDLATLSGFADIYSMIEALTNPTPTPETTAVKERVDAAMLQEFGADLDAQSLQTKAVEVVQNDKFQQLQQLQLRILRRLAAQPMARIAQRQAEQEGAPAAAVDRAATEAAQAEQAAARTPREGVQASLARIRADVQRTANASQRRAQVAARRQTASIRLGIDPAAITEAARRYVRTLKVKDATPARYRQAAARLTAKIERAIADRDYTQAATLMEQRALNLAVAKEASMIQTKIETQRTRWREVTARSDKRLAQRYSIDWVNAIRVVLEPFGMARNTPRNYDPVRALADLQAVEPTLYTEIRLAISAYAVRSRDAAQANPNNPYKDLSVQEALDLLETADTLLANARDSRGILVEGRRVEFGAIADEVSVNVSKRRKVQKQAGRLGRGRGSRTFRATRRQLGAFKANLRRIEQWARDFDNGNPRGPLTRYLVRPVMRAVDAYIVARKGPQEALAALLRTRTDLMARRPIRAQELDGYVFQTKGELIMALLHTGNASNKRKLLLGGATDVETNRRYVWGSQDADGNLDTSRWDAFVDRLFADGVLTQADMELVQGIWDIFKTTKQAAQAAHKQMYGYYFTEVQADPVVTPFGVYPGGYAPAITDSMMNPDGTRFEAEEVMSQQSNASMFPGAEKGFTQSRTEYNQPLDLDLTRIPAHFDRVMKFAYLGPAVRQAARLVTNRSFREAVRPGSPDVIDVAIIPWLQRTVQQRVTTPPPNQGWSGLARVAAAIDRRVGLHIMAANLVNAAQQITGFPVAAARIPARHLAVAATRWRVNNQSARAYIIAQSPFMEERMIGGMNEASTTLERILSEPGLLNRLQDASMRYGYFAQQIAQNLVDPTVWLAAERHGMEVVYPTAYAEALDRTGDEAAADTAARAEVVAYADSVVRDTQTPLRPSDVSGIEASSPLARMFLKFYSYFNSMGNLLVTEKNIAMNSDMGWAGRYGRSFYAYLMIVTIPTIIAESIAQLARGGFEDLEDEDERDQLMFELLIGSQLKTMAAMVPLAGSLATTAYGIAVTEQVYDDRISLSAGLGVTESTLQNLTRLLVAAANPDTDIETRRAIRTVLDALGLALGLPTNWASKPISYAVSVAEGDSRPEGFGDILQGALAGKDGTDR